MMLPLSKRILKGNFCLTKYYSLQLLLKLYHLPSMLLILNNGIREILKSRIIAISENKAWSCRLLQDRLKISKGPWEVKFLIPARTASRLKPLNSWNWLNLFF